MSSSTGRSALWTSAPSRLRQDRPLMAAKSRPSATSFTVKSNSLRATKSTTGASRRRLLRLHRHLGADQPDLERRVLRLQPLRHLHVGGEGGRRGVQHREVVVARHRRHLGQALPVRRRVHEARAFHQRRRLREPGREPEALDLAPRLVAGAGAAVEAVEGGRLEEQGPHHRPHPTPQAAARPSNRRGATDTAGRPRPPGSAPARPPI